MSAERPDEGRLPVPPVLPPSPLPRQKKPIALPTITDDPKVLLLVDWENLFYSLWSDAGDMSKVDIERRIKRLLEWTRAELGALFGGCGFVFAPGHFSHRDKEFCADNGLRIIICPKRGNEDTVDETLVWFGLNMAKHPEVKIVCLASGDSDYAPMLDKLRDQGIKIALAPATLNSLSRAIAGLIDRHPTSGSKMVLLLNKV